MLKNIDKKMLKMFGIVIGIVALIFIILIIIIAVNGSTKTYLQVENMMIDGAKKYYQKNTDALPNNDNETSTISSDKLIEEGYLASFDKLLKDPTCSGQVNVSKSGNSYLYNATLNCNEKYATKKFKNILIDTVVNSGNGLYKYNDTYIYRGDDVNNYVSFADKIWRILKINADGSIKLIDTTKYNKVVWDDRYNSDKSYNIGINDYTVSRIKETLDEIEETYTNEDLSYMMKQNLCIGKRSNSDTSTDGNIECSKTFDNQYLGLIQINEFAQASLSELCKSPLDMECTNYNYLSDLRSSWTLTADSNTSYKVYKLANNIYLANANSSAQPSVVITINPNVNYATGDGTLENPYTFR